MLVPLYRVFLCDDDMAAQARFATRLDRAAGLPFVKANEIMQQYEQELRTDAGGFLMKLLMPALSHAMTSAALADARHATARVGLAVYAYRARNGRLPDRLDDLAPDFLAAVPDPFDGQAMKFKRAGPRTVVYSVGPDLIDNGGAPFDEKTKTGDITFELPAAK